MPTITDFSRVTTKYTDDTGSDHEISQRRATAVGVGNTYAELATGIAGRPAKWKLRHVQGKFIDGSNKVFHKRAVIGSVSNPLWTGASSSWTEDGVLWVVQGRIGEKRLVA